MSYPGDEDTEPSLKTRYAKAERKTDGALMSMSEFLARLADSNYTALILGVSALSAIAILIWMFW